VVLQQFDEDLVPAVLILPDGQFELRLVADGLAQKANVCTVRRRAFNGAAMQNVAVSVKVDIFQEGLKDVSALQVENLQGGWSFVLLGCVASCKQLDAHGVEVAAAKPALDRFPVRLTPFVAAPRNGTGPPMLIDEGWFVNASDMWDGGQARVPVGQGNVKEVLE
jgi:hypothetical protein